MGGFTVTPTVQVAIPANTYAGTYTSTVRTVAVVSGPEEARHRNPGS